MTQQRRIGDAAAAVIGSVLLEPDLAGEVLRLVAETDMPGEYRVLYAGIRQLFAACSPVDAVTLAAIVAVVLGLSAVGYVGEAIVKAQSAMRSAK